MKGTVVVKNALINNSNEEIRIVNDNVYLRIPRWTKPRRIGSIQMVGGNKVYFRPFSPNKHIMFRINAVGINAQLFSIFPDTMYIALRESSGKTLYVSVGRARGVLINNGYKKDGYDKQVFIPLEAFEKEAPPSITSEVKKDLNYNMVFHGEGESKTDTRKTML